MNANSIANQMQLHGANARRASALMAKASAAQKNQALNVLAAKLRLRCAELLEANHKDCLQAQSQKISDVLLDRLRLTQKIIETCALGCEQLAHNLGWV